MSELSIRQDAPGSSADQIAAPAARLHDRSPLAAWVLDEVFLGAAMERAQAADIVSLDVFDTALTRTLDSPADAFAEIERRLVDQIGAAAHGYAQAREDAERQARLRQVRVPGAEEIDLDAVLQEVADRLPLLAAHRQLLGDTEIAVERSLLVGVPDILALTRRLRDIGKPFLFVSDMYLPRAAIAGFLADAGYAGWRALHVSSESGATKASGRQWQAVRYAEFQAPAQAPAPPVNRILHIGDDPHADVEAPQAHGIDTLLYARARSERRLGVTLRPALLAFSRAQRASVLRGRVDASRGATPPTKAATRWRAQGQVLGAIVLGSFLRWLESRVRLHRIDKLYFCARDGWLIQRAWKAAGLDRATGIEDHYLFVSRRPLNLARGAVQSSPGQLDATLLGFAASTHGNTTIGTALERIGLSDEPEILADLRAQRIDPGHPLVWPDGSADFKALLSRHSARVHGRLRQGHAALLGYLRQERFGVGGRCGIVDIGWHGSMQRSLRTILEAEQGNTPLVGFYYGLWPAAGGNRFKAGVMESVFASDFIPGEQQPELHEAVEILEELHAAPHGTVRSYREVEGAWQPVFADNPDELRQYETVTRHFQDGALEAVAALFATGRSGALRLDELTPDAARAALGAVCLSPSAEELSLFGDLGHCATFDHACFERLVPRGCPADVGAMERAFRRSGWRAGTLRAWYEAADGAGRERVAGFAEANLHAPPRALRQFGR